MSKIANRKGQVFLPSYTERNNYSSRRNVVSFVDVLFFINKLGIERENIDKVEHQFSRYQIDDIAVDDSDRIDEIWAKLMPKYPELSHVMLAICTIFHGNADSERVFSAVRHIDTDFRQCMSEELFDALMVVKRHLLVSIKECHNDHFTPEFLARAKSATTKANLNLQKEGDSADIKGDDVSGKILRMLGAGDNSGDFKQ